MLELVRCDASQSGAGLQAGGQKDASSDRGVRNDLQMMSLRVTANSHELRDSGVAHLRLNDVARPAIDA